MGDALPLKHILIYFYEKPISISLSGIHQSWVRLYPFIQISIGLNEKQISIPLHRIDL